MFIQLWFGPRPMGAAALLAVKDKAGPQLYLVDPAGTGLVIFGLPSLCTEMLHNHCLHCLHLLLCTKRLQCMIL